MSSSGEDQNEINSERAWTNARCVDIESRCIYPNERRERNQIYTLLNISNSVNEEEEKFLESGTGWEEAVQGWSKTLPFAYLQLQKRSSKAKTSETANGCLYCADLMQGIDRDLEQDAKALVEQVKSDFRSSIYTATDGNPEKKQTLFYSNPTPVSSATTDDPRRESDGKFCSSQTFQGEKKKMSLKEAQSSLSERRFFVMKESPLFQAEKKMVPIKEYSITPPGNPKSIEVLKCKDTKNHELLSLCDPMASDATAAKSTLVLPPLKDAALKNSLDPSPRKKQLTLSQASEKPLLEATPFPRALKTKEQNRGKGIGAMYNALKEQMKMHEIASLVPRLSKTSFLTRNLDRCCWHYTNLPDRRIGAVSNSIASRRHSNPKGVHFLHTKAAQVSKAHGIQDPYARSRSHTGTKQHKESKAQETPLLSGLFPSLTVSRLAITALPSRLTRLKL